MNLVADLMPSTQIVDFIVDLPRNIMTGDIVKARVVISTVVQIFPIF